MRYSFLLFSLLFSVVITGCNQGAEQKTSVPKTAMEKINVVTSFYPLAFFTQEIAGEHANVINLSGNQSPHSYKISPHDRVLLSNADLVIYQGIGLEPWAEDIIPELKQKNIAVLQATKNLNIQKMAEKYAGLDEDESNHDEHKNNNEELNPHTWLDPILAQKMAQNISQKLIEIDPKNAKEYTKNTEHLIQKLKTLDAEYKTTLAHCKNKKAIVSHDAFGYLESRYGFKLYPIAGVSPSDTPSAKLMAELKNVAESEHITSILTEENAVKKYVQTLARETGLQMSQANPMGSTPTTGDYFKIAKDNLKNLSKAFQCQ